MPWAELMALDELAENINAAGFFEARVDGPVPSHLHRNAGQSEARDQWRLVATVLRCVWSHLAAKELEIGSSTLIDI